MQGNLELPPDGSAVELQTHQSFPVNGCFSKGYNEIVTIDKALYRKAFEQYRQWNEAEIRERFHTAGKHTPQERWKEYLSLWSFSQKLGAKSSQYQRKQKLESLDLYYSRLQKMEAWRKARGS